MEIGGEMVECWMTEHPPIPHKHLERKNNRKPPWFSRKWWAALIGFIVLTLNATLGWELNTAEILGIILPLIAYILGEAWVDSHK